jgi:aerobic carbon-monoxide dehydrogenase large subunit
LGAKDVGEGGTIASTTTVMNAILEVLAPLGVSDLPIPATPERIWRAVREHPQSSVDRKVPRIDTPTR